MTGPRSYVIMSVYSIDSSGGEFGKGSTVGISLRPAYMGVSAYELFLYLSP